MKAERLHLPANQTEPARPNKADPGPMKTARRVRVLPVPRAMPIINLTRAPIPAEPGLLDRARPPRQLDPRRKETAHPGAGLRYGPWASLSPTTRTRSRPTRAEAGLLARARRPRLHTTPLQTSGHLTERRVPAIPLRRYSLRSSSIGNRSKPRIRLNKCRRHRYGPSAASSAWNRKRPPERASRSPADRNRSALWFASGRRQAERWERNRAHPRIPAALTATTIDPQPGF
jgi:hypothetical protein